MSNSILLIDDNPRLVKALQTHLESHGYQVHAAACGADGLISARMFQPRVILLDVQMPGMDGYTVCHLLRTDPALHDVYVIVISAIGREAARQAAIEAGANEFLAKPYDVKRILDLVRAAMKRDEIKKSRPEVQT